MYSFVILGIVIGIYVTLLSMFIIGPASRSKLRKKAVLFTTILIIIIASCMAASVARAHNSANVDAWIAAQQNHMFVIENGEPHRPNGITIDRINELNHHIARHQRRAARWWGFTYDRRVLDLELIVIE